jgi:hypothetical protein
MVDARVTKSLTAKRESKSIEFKEQFIPTDPRQSLEVLKDIVAISNSGGGTLVIGINNVGQATGGDVKPVLDYDHAKYCDLIRKYTNQNYADFEVIEAEKDGHTVAVFLIDPPDYPLVSEKPGTYPIEGSKHQQTAFAQGTLCFRHGAKTESATSDDLRRFMQNRFKEIQDQLVKGMRIVSESPRGSELTIVPAGIVDSSCMGGTPLRITTNPDAPGAIAVDRHRICPYRQKEVIKKLKERLSPDLVPSTNDFQAIVKIHNVVSDAAFAWKPEFSSRQYSAALVDWVVERISENHDFAHEARRKLYEKMHPPVLPFND